MSFNVNQVNLAGRLASDPRGGKTSNGNSYSDFLLAVDRFGARPDQNGHTPADFISVTEFKKQADYMNKYGHKGDPAAIFNARWNTRRYQKNGENRKANTAIGGFATVMHNSNQNNQNGNGNVNHGNNNKQPKKYPKNPFAGNNNPGQGNEKGKKGGNIDISDDDLPF